MVGVGIQDQLGVRHILNEIKRIHCVNDDVVISVHDQRWLLDVLQIREALSGVRAPFADGGDLGRHNLVADRGIAVLSARKVALQEGSASRLTLLRISKEDFQPQVLGWVVGRAKDRRRLWGDVALAISRVKITRGGPDQDELANQIRTVECDLLRDHSADRETEKIDLRQSETIDERFRVLRHTCKGRRHFAGRARDARIIEDDDLTLLGKPVQNRRIPVVEVSGEVLIKHKRQTASLAPTPISEANAVGLNKLRRNCDCCVGTHCLILFRCDQCSFGCQSSKAAPSSHVSADAGYFFCPAGTASDKSARAALAQSMSFGTVGAPLSPIAPTISPSTLMGNPPPHAAIRASVGMPAKRDGSPWIKLKRSCVETPNKAVYALFCAISMQSIGAPSIRLKALRLPPSSRIATFSLTPSALAFASAASTIFCASSEEILCFFTTLAIGLLHPFDIYCALILLYRRNPTT